MAELMRWKEPAAATTVECYRTKIGGVFYWLSAIFMLWCIYNAFLPFDLWSLALSNFAFWVLYPIYVEPQLRKLVPCSLTASGISQSPIRSVAWEEIEYYSISEQAFFPQMRCITINKKKKQAKWYQPDLAINRWPLFIYDPREVDESKLRALLAEYVPQWPAERAWATIDWSV